MLTEPPENFTITVVEVTSNSSILHVNYGISKETDVTIGISSPGVVPNNTTWYYILNNTGYINVSGLRPGHNYTVSASSCNKEFYSTTLATEGEITAISVHGWIRLHFLSCRIYCTRTEQYMLC